MNIRLATVQDMDAILAIYAYARTQMKNNHNPHQWGDHHPAIRSTIWSSRESVR